MIKSKLVLIQYLIKKALSRDPDRGDLIRHGRVLDFLSRLLRPPTAGCQGRHFYSADGRDMSGQPAMIRHSRPPLLGGHVRFLDHSCRPLSGN